MELELSVRVTYIFDLPVNGIPFKNIFRSKIISNTFVEHLTLSFSQTQAKKKKIVSLRHY